jgi:hypothetical protein
MFVKAFWAATLWLLTAFMLSTSFRVRFAALSLRPIRNSQFAISKKELLNLPIVCCKLPIGQRAKPFAAVPLFR